MKKKLSKAVGLSLLAIITFFSSNQAVPAADDKAAIEMVRIAFNSAYGKGDAAAMGALIDGEAIWMPPTGEEAIVGAERIVARYSAFFEKTHSTFELEPGNIQLCGEWAFLHGPWKRRDVAKEGGRSIQHYGYYMMIFKKQPDGSWKIARDIWNDVKTPDRLQ